VLIKMHRSMDFMKNPNNKLLDDRFEQLRSDLWRARIVWDIRTGRREKQGKELPVVYETDQERASSEQRQSIVHKVGPSDNVESNVHAVGDAASV
jgi:hypothetical protein